MNFKLSQKAVLILLTFILMGCTLVSIEEATSRVSSLSCQERWQTYTKTDGLDSSAVFSVFVDDQNNIWTGTDTGVNRLDTNGEWTSYEFPVGDVTTSAVVEIDSDLQDRIWVALRPERIEQGWVGGGAAVLISEEQDRWEIYTSESGLVSNLVTTLAIDAQNRVWIGTDGSGVSVLEQATQQWVNYTENDGLLNNTVQAILFDSEGNIWLSTGYSGSVTSGVSTLAAGSEKWETFTSPDFVNASDGLASSLVLAIAEDRTGDIWFGTYAGVSVLNPDTNSWTNFNSQNSGLTEQTVQAIAIDDSNNKWFATVDFSDEESGAVGFLSSENDWRVFTEDDGLASNRVLDIAIDQQGNTWFATTQGLSVRCNSK